MIRVWIPDTSEKKGGEHARLVGKHDCPSCQGKNSLTIVGSRAASLTAVLISQLWASPFNPEEKKLLAFSDNVQDASHRAGFFKARTFRFNLRTAIQKVVQEDYGAAAADRLAASVSGALGKGVRASRTLCGCVPSARYGMAGGLRGTAP